MNFPPLRISRLMALAIHTQRLVDEGEVRDYAELARVGHVSRARVTQIMNLNFLAPDIQEEILFLPRVERGRDPIREHAVRPIAAMFDWRKQRRMWITLRRGGMAASSPLLSRRSQPVSAATANLVT